MATIEERQAWRRALLVGLCNEVGDNTLEKRMPTDIAAAVGVPDDELDSVTNWCAHEGLLEFASMAGDVSITHGGIAEAERLTSERVTLTAYLNAVELRELEALLGQIDRTRERVEIKVCRGALDTG